MKKLVVGSFVFVLTLMLFTNVFARNLEITEYCGDNGLINRGNDPVQVGDVLNVRNDIKQENATGAPESNTILSQAITINGNNHKFDGNGLGGFKMMQYNTGIDCDSTINNATLTNYNDDVITVNEQYVYYLDYGVTLNNVKISSNTGNAVKSVAGYVTMNNVTINNCVRGLDIKNGYAELNNVKISSMSQEGLSINGAEVYVKDCEITDTYYEPFYVTNGSTVTIVTTRNITYAGGNAGYKSVDNQGSEITFLPANGTTVKLSSGISGGSEGSIIVGDGEQYTGTLALSGDSSPFSGNVEMNGTTIKLLANSYYFDNSNHTVWNGKLDILNNSSDSIKISNLSGDILKIDLDVDLENTENSDYIKAETADIEKVIINKINVTTDSVTDITNVEVVNNVLSSSTTLASNQRRVFGPIYGYDVYISTSGVPVNEMGVSLSSGVIPSDVIISTTGNILTFSRASDSYNPDILQGKVAIAGASISREEIFDTVLNNAGNYTFFQKQGSSAGDVEDRAAPTLWVKAFGSQEDVDLEKYTKLKTTYYGAVVGLDCDRQYTDNFDATYGIFASYIGGELKDDEYSSNKVKQNGGYAGLRANWYIGKLFINGIADYGLIQNSADTSSDSNDFNSQVIGLAARLGYNFEVARRSFTIQPSVAATGKYIITDDFETIVSSGDKFKEKIDDIQNITIEPGLKLVKNLGRCWILTGEGKYVIENVSGDVKISSEDLELVLPDMSYKNYANVGLGIEKIWGYTVLHLKGNKTFGGRDGFVVNAGIEFKF